MPTTVIEWILHLDKYLAAIAAEHGVLIYALLFAVIFIETGLVVMPFLPGDSLLFVAGALAAKARFRCPCCFLCCWLPPSSATPSTTRSVLCCGSGSGTGAASR